MGVAIRTPLPPLPPSLPRGGDRGAGIWTAQWAPEEDEDVFAYVSSSDKQNRVQVHRYVPAGGFEFERHPRIDFLKRRPGKPLLPFFQYETGQSARPQKSTGWVSGYLDTAPAAAEKTALLSLTAARAAVSGVSEAQLAADKISGTHPDRHVGPEVGARLAWPVREIDVLGDWAHNDKPTGGRPPRKAAKARPSSSTTYHPRSSKEEAVATRKRFSDAARAFIERAGGYEALTAETSWHDIIPRVSPGAAYDAFYGTSWSGGREDELGKAVALVRAAASAVAASPSRASKRLRAAASPELLALEGAPAGPLLLL